MEMVTEFPADEDFPRRTFYFCSADNLADLAKEVRPTSRYFVLFLAMDARGTGDTVIRDFASEISRKGMACLCAWGPGCKRVHDLFDQVLSAEYPDPTDENVIMTTWHSDEPLREALWYFARAGSAAEDYWRTCTDWVAASVGNPDWELTIRNKLRGLAEHLA